jgi:hypothetical protein
LEKVEPNMIIQPLEKVEPNMIIQPLEKVEPNKNKRMLIYYFDLNINQNNKRWEIRHPFKK